MKSNKSYYHIVVSILIIALLFGFERYQHYKHDQSTRIINKGKVEELLQSPQSSKITPSRPSNIPKKAYDVWYYVREYHQPMKGYVGGREFKNLEHRLEIKAKDGHRIRYQEWDVNPKREGRNRGAERLVTSDEERAWYTSDHYQSFTELE